MRWRSNASSSPRALRRRCLRLLRDLPIPNPFSVPELVRNMEAVRRRRIHLVELAEDNVGFGSACGLRVRAEDATYVLYRQRPTIPETEHTILHELVHEWFDHGTTLTPPELQQYVPAYVLDDLVHRFGPAPVIQARARYETPEEQEAELSASLIKRIARQQPPPADDMVSRLENSLSHPVAQPRRGWK